jgi:transcriptional regulator with XRE-family HTH domain
LVIQGRRPRLGQKPVDKRTLLYTRYHASFKRDHKTKRSRPFALFERWSNLRFVGRRLILELFLAHETPIYVLTSRKEKAVSELFDLINSQVVWAEFVSFRKKKGITQIGLAQKVNVTQGLISQYETGLAGGSTVTRNVEMTILMCEAIGFPHESFIKNLRTKNSKIAECQTLYLARASNEISQAATKYGITTKDPELRLEELDKSTVFQHRLVAEYRFTNYCIASAVETSIKQVFGYNKKVGEYLAVSPNAVRQHIEDLIEHAQWDYTMILAPEDHEDVSDLQYSGS